MRYWDDLELGEVHELGPITVSEEEMVEFALRYDAQPFHIDPEAAKETPFGGLIASGWQTTALFMSLYARDVLNHQAGVGGGAVDELRFRAPVRPGDALRIRTTVVELWPSTKGLPRGSVVSEVEIYNQRDELVLTMRIGGFVARRA